MFCDICKGKQKMGQIFNAYKGLEICEDCLNRLKKESPDLKEIEILNQLVKEKNNG